MEAAEAGSGLRVTKFIIESSAIGYTTSFFVVMNKKVWSSLDLIPRDHREGQRGVDCEGRQRLGKERGSRKGIRHQDGC
jgi:hypothetical protein